ncbi:MAG TPA: SOS response-associated peptidase [Anaerolineae bacterium]|nr:SOS response-associated peptidase [Anaerolineae bacterium]HQH38910.1 SOS response-associated peptidase [Anaerolineae bacterium]
MCGRFSLGVNLDDLIEAFPDFTFPPELSPHYNIAPSQDVAVVPNNTERRVEFFHWGLIPSWAKDPEIGNRLINARAETLAEKPSFRAAYLRRRCLILADGFYEWQTLPGSKVKQPMYIQLATKKPFAFAGLWELWRPDDTPILSCTIITTEPNALLAPIHNRMPVILPPEAYNLWLDPTEQKPNVLNPLLKPYPADLMIVYPVSRLVNDPANDVPDCVVPNYE